MDETPDTRPDIHYRWPARYLHWTMALLVPTLIGLGWYMLSIEEEPGSSWYFALHVSLGITAAALIALRMLWRFGHPPPALPAATPGWQLTVARLSHALLYLLLVLMPVAGYLGASFSGEAIAFFGVPLPAWAGKDDALKELFFEIHSVIGWLLVAAIAVHVLAAMKHLMIDKDDVFRRMWPL